MQMTEDNERISAEAADWLITNQDERPMGDEQRRRFAEWLESSPRHAEEYLEIAQLAGDFSMAANVDGVSIDALVERARAMDDGAGGAQILALSGRSRGEKVSVLRRHPWLPFAAAAAFALVAVGPWLSSSLWSGAQMKELRFASGHGPLLPPQPLEDGSVLQLNTDTAVVVRYSATERRVEIERGQAVFTVAHETARPFLVIAGAAQILDIGTKFDVYLKSDATVVTVLEGKVEVSSQRATGRLRLVAGQQAWVRAGELPPAPLAVDVEREMAYLSRLIDVEDKPLSYVVEEFNRYIAVPIQIGTPQLREMRVRGSFSVDDVESFLGWLKDKGVRVDSTPARILVSKS